LPPEAAVEARKFLVMNLLMKLNLVQYFSAVSHRE
jgi:hypothetical protein